MQLFFIHKVFPRISQFGIGTIGGRDIMRSSIKSAEGDGFGHWACRRDRTRRWESGVCVGCNRLLMYMFVNVALWIWLAALRNSHWINKWWSTLWYSENCDYLPERWQKVWETAVASNGVWHNENHHGQWVHCAEKYFCFLSKKFLFLLNCMRFFSFFTFTIPILGAGFGRDSETNYYQQSTNLNYELFWDQTCH